jgi:uncharacterized protein
MNAAHGSAARRPTKNLTSNKSVGRDSVEPVGNYVSEWDFAIAGTSEIARRRLLSMRGEPLFFAEWENVTFIHYQTDPQELQRCIPYHLDLYDGKAFVSLVAFTMRGMRPRFGGSLSALFFKPISTHHFLNVRTYVTHQAEPGIYFMQEWLSSRLATWLGPCSFGLPYRFAQMNYHRNHEHERRGKIEASTGSFQFCATLEPKDPRICAPASLDEFLLERYTAFTQVAKRRRFFRIWHEPWQQTRIDVNVVGGDLLAASGSWWQNAQLVGANYSRGVRVWMGWPHTIAKSAF